MRASARDPPLHQRWRRSAGRQSVAAPLGLGVACAGKLSDATRSASPTQKGERRHVTRLTRDTRTDRNTTQSHTGTHSFIQFNSIQFNSIQFNSIQFNSIQFNSIQFNSIQFNSIQFNSVQFISFHFISFYFISFHFISFHFISFHSSVSLTHARHVHAQ